MQARQSGDANVEAGAQQTRARIMAAFGAAVGFAACLLLVVIRFIKMV